MCLLTCAFTRVCVHNFTNRTPVSRSRKGKGVAYPIHLILGYNKNMWYTREVRVKIPVHGQAQLYVLASKSQHGKFRWYMQRLGAAGGGDAIRATVGEVNPLSWPQATPN